MTIQNLGTRHILIYIVFYKEKKKPGNGFLCSHPSRIDFHSFLPLPSNSLFYFINYYWSNFNILNIFNILLSFGFVFSFYYFLSFYILFMASRLYRANISLGSNNLLYIIYSTVSYHKCTGLSLRMHTAYR